MHFFLSKAKKKKKELLNLQLIYNKTYMYCKSHYITQHTSMVKELEKTLNEVLI